MVIYLLMLALIASGAILFALAMIQSLLELRRVSTYDAHGYFMVVVVFLTFAISSLAYFWGELRFYPGSEVVSESLIGVLLVLACSFVGLAYGFTAIKSTMHCN
ncbi:MAG: hypothetical protein P8X79_07685 [Reinekea sp.]